jgi:RNA polymerase sigma-70 factor, ECF subfamily
LGLAKKISDEKTRRYTEVYSMYYSLIFSSIYSKVANFHEVEDICQEVFLRLFDKFDEVREPRKWLYGTLRNVVLDYYNEKRRKDLNNEELFEDISMSFVNGMKDVRIIIEEAMDELSEDEDDMARVVFDLIAVHNYSYNMVSKELGLTYKQVRTIFGKMSHKLSLYLNSKGIKTLEDLL